MEADFAFLCDYADPSGKLAAFGIGIDLVHAPVIPAVHRSMMVVCQLRGSVTEAGPKAFSLQMIDADGTPVFTPLVGEIELRPPEEGAESTARICVNLWDIQLAKYGDHSIHILIDGNEVKRLRLRVVAPSQTN